MFSCRVWRQASIKDYQIAARLNNAPSSLNCYNKRAVTLQFANSHLIKLKVLPMVHVVP